MVNTYPKKTSFEIPKGSTEIASDKWENDEYATKMSYEKTKQDREGIRILSVKKTNYKPHFGIWLDKKIDYSIWFKWFSSAFKKLARLFNKDVETTEDLVKRYEQEREDLSKKLAELTLKYEKAKIELKQQREELELAKQLVGDVKFFENSLNELKDEIKKSKNNNERLEKSIKSKIVSNKWIIGLDCQVKAKEESIDNQAAIDLHIKTDLGEDRIFEFKSPNIDPFQKKTDNGRLHINQEFGEGVNQLVDYMKKTDIYSALEESGTYKIKKPSGVIVIGYNLDTLQETLLKNWSYHLRPHIRIMTYNDLLEGAEKNLENIKCVRGDKNKIK